MVSPRNNDGTSFERLAKGIQNRLCEFGQLIQKQHPAMRQGNLARLGPCPTANKGRHRGRMVRVPKRTCLDQPARGQLAGNGMQHRDIQRLTR